MKKQILDWLSGLGRQVSAIAHIPQRLYLVVAIVGVVGFVFITPPFQGPDEQAHYIRTQYIAHGYFIPVNVTNSEASLPKSIQDVLHITFFADDLRGNITNNYELSRTKEALQLPLNADERYKPPMITYNFVPYLPAIPAVWIANILNLSPLVSMYLARLSLGLAAVGIFFFAIRLIPTKKYLLAVVALVPMMLFQASMIGIDGVSYALLALFIAYILYLYMQKSITNRQWVFLGLLCVAIVCAKPLVYVFLPLVILLIKKKHALKWIAATAAVCALVLFGSMKLMSIENDVSVSAAGLPEHVDSKAQQEILIDNPKRGMRVLWNSYMTHYGDDEVRGVIGVFGAADTLYPIWMTYVYIFVLSVAGVIAFGVNKLRVPLLWRWLAVVLGAVYFVGVNLAIYLGYTPVNFDIVYGVQGRYFLPLLLVAVAVLTGVGFRVSKKDEARVRVLIFVTIAMIVLMALFITYQRYFLYTP